MLKKIGFLVAVLMVFSCTAFAADWRWSNSNDRMGFFFDTQSIKYDRYLDGRINKNAVVVWVKTVYSQEGANELADKWKDNRYYNLDYCISKETFLIYAKKIKLGDATYYDKNGSVLDVLKSPGGFPTDILPDSTGEALYLNICEFCRMNDSYVTRNTI